MYHFVPELDKFQSRTLSTGAMDESKDQELNITASQARVRKVIAKDLPDFSGDPADGSSFMARFVESTRCCACTDVSQR